MLPASFATMLQSIVSGEYGVNPTVIYNENWMLRLLLYHHHEGAGCFPFSSDPDSQWFFEAKLPTQFKARQRGDHLSENRARVSGAYGHLRIEKGARAGLLLDEKASKFIVLEAKMFSTLASGIRNMPDYDQAARAVACMATTIESSDVSVSDLRDLGFYVVAPREQIMKGVFSENMKSLSILGKVEARIEAYRDDPDTYDMLQVWKKDYFEPVLNRVQLRSISWEETIDRMVVISPEKAAIREYYEKCLDYNR